MQKQILLTILYDYYGVLLTEKQQNYFKDYYFNNLSLSEISENNSVSRNAVHKQLKEIEREVVDVKREVDDIWQSTRQSIGRQNLKRV